MNRENANIADGFVRKISSFFSTLLAPVSLTLLLTVATSGMLTSSTDVDADFPQPFLAKQNSTSDYESLSPITQSIINVLGVVVLVTLTTFVIFGLYKYGYTKVLYGWLLYSSASLLLMMTWAWVRAILVYVGIPYTIFSVMIFVWNFGVVGIISVSYYTLPLLRHAYLIFASLTMINVLLQLPEVTGWLLLVAIALYDIAAVLCPVGPLRLLVEESNHRQDPLPGFVYDADPDLRKKKDIRNIVRCRGKNHSTIERVLLPSKLLQRSHSISPGKLGLGDFIFFGLLVGLASQRGFVEWTLCFFAILVGMDATFITLFFNRHRIPAFPALPFSVFLATFVYLSARHSVNGVTVFAAIEGLLF